MCFHLNALGQSRLPVRRRSLSDITCDGGGPTTGSHVQSVHQSAGTVVYPASTQTPSIALRHPLPLTTAEIGYTIGLRKPLVCV